MKRKLTQMDPDEFVKLKQEGKVALVERNVEPGGIQLVNPFAVGRTDSGNLVELAQEIQKVTENNWPWADQLIRTTACSKLQVIAEQIRFLQQQAHKVLMEAKENTSLHHASCNFRKIPGHIYHLYERESGQSYFSMLSPEEWRSSERGPPHKYIGAYHLEQDASWTPVESLVARSNELKLMDKIFASADILDIARQSNVDKSICDVEMM